MKLFETDLPITRDSFPEGTRSLKIIETLISRVYLTDNHAYKIKKPVNMGFCNFVSLARRKRFCLLEIDKNRWLAKRIYQGVVPVKLFGGRAVFGGSQGKAVDYAVKMTRLPENQLLSRLLRRGKVKIKEIEMVADLVADFHMKAQPLTFSQGHRALRNLKKLWQQNFDQTAGAVGKFISSKDFDEFKFLVERSFLEKEKLFNERIVQGKFKDCHGDLHTGNIFVIRDSRRGTTPLIFDSIEFNQDLTWGDVGCDVAFLTMDLKFRGRPDLAELFLRQYLVKTQDREIVASGLLNFYECYRAYVRGKVDFLRLGGADLKSEERRRLGAEARKYFKFSFQASHNI